MSEVLSREFYLQDTVTVARRLIGKVLIHETETGTMSGRIAETEAYLMDDPACHACRGMTRRNAAMFGEPGRAYLYFTYGAHFCLNFVTRPQGTAEAVLIRAVIPTDGIDRMRHNRGRHSLHDLCSGPGKLTQAMDIDLSLNGEDLLGGRLFVIDDGTPTGRLAARPRIGIRHAKDKLWRFYSPKWIEWVSRR